MSTRSTLPSAASSDPGGDARGLVPLMDVAELAAYLGVPVSTVYDWRTRRKGPPAYRFGKHLKFAVADVQAWVEAQREPGEGR
nr:helix-turn-helix domain-containing protein [Propionicimonas sp.]